MTTPPSFSIGIEEEYQIIDPKTRELRSYITQLLEAGKVTLREQIKAEMHQSMVEVGSEVCRTPADLRLELVRLRRGIIDLSAKSGLKIAAAGSHPFSSWVEQEITPFDRYAGVKQDMQMLAQQLLIFGTHIHVGIEDPDILIDVMNMVRYGAGETGGGGKDSWGWGPPVISVPGEPGSRRTASRGGRRASGGYTCRRKSGQNGPP